MLDTLSLDVLAAVCGGRQQQRQQVPIPRPRPPGAPQQDNRPWHLRALPKGDSTIDPKFEIKPPNIHDDGILRQLRPGGRINI
jgi:hypothetical protein